MYQPKSHLQARELSFWHMLAATYAVGAMLYHNPTNHSEVMSRLKYDRNMYQNQYRIALVIAKYR